MKMIYIMYYYVYISMKSIFLVIIRGIGQKWFKKLNHELKTSKLQKIPHKNDGVTTQRTWNTFVALKTLFKTFQKKNIHMHWTLPNSIVVYT